MRRTGRTRQKRRSMRQGMGRYNPTPKPKPKPKPKPEPSTERGKIIDKYRNTIRMWDTAYIEDQVRAMDNLPFMILNDFDGLNTVLFLLKLELEEREEGINKR